MAFADIFWPNMLGGNRKGRPNPSILKLPSPRFRSAGRGDGVPDKLNVDYRIPLLNWWKPRTHLVKNFYYNAFLYTLPRENHMPLWLHEHRGKIVTRSCRFLENRVFGNAQPIYAFITFPECGLEKNFQGVSSGIHKPQALDA